MHIRKHEHDIDDKWAPMEVTQQGIAAAIQRPRAHTSVILRELEMRGAVMTQMRHVSNANTRCRYRKVYRTTNRNGVCIAGRYVQVPLLKMAEVQQHVKALSQLLNMVNVEEEPDGT